MSRLVRFRAFVARMDPTAEPYKALQEGLVVEQPDGGVAATLATRLELEPTSTHLVVGYVGSGKTTTALRVGQRLKAASGETGDRVAYIDVSGQHRMDDEGLEGILFALAGLDLGAHLTSHGQGRLGSDVKGAWDTIRKWARGHSEWVYDDDDYEDGYDQEPPDDDEGPPPRRVRHAGLVKPVERPLSYRLEPLVEPLRVLRRALGAHAIYLFDSLDRLKSPARFTEAVGEDVRALKRAEIGSVVIGPIRYALGQDPAIQDLFDHVHFIRPPDPNEPSGMTFCCDVLRRRADADMLPDALLPAIARASGGILRDLVGIARRAGEEAYARGADQIAVQDVDIAARALGESLAFGIDSAELAVLRHLHRGGGFVIRGERELALIEQRRVVPAGVGAWRVHPALEPVLAAIPNEAA